MPQKVVWAGAAFAAAALVVLVLKLVARTFPEKFARYHRNRTSLEARNEWIGEVAEILAIVGFFAPFGLYWKHVNEIGWPAIGFQFGAGAILPLVWICAATLPLGRLRFQEFWRYYTLRHNVGVGGLLAVFIPLCVVGAISAIMLIKGGFL